MEKINYNTLSKEDFLKKQKYRNDILKKISSKIEVNSYKDEEVQQCVLELFNWMNEFYDCSIDMFKGLAEIYEFNSEFSNILVENYHKQMPGFLSKSMIYFCENKK